MLQIVFTPILRDKDKIDCLSSGEIVIAGDYGVCSTLNVSWLVTEVCDLLSGLLNFLTNRPTDKQYNFSTNDGTFALRVFRKKSGLIWLYCLDSDRLIAETNAEELRGAVWAAARPLCAQYLTDLQKAGSSESDFAQADEEYALLFPELLNQWLEAFPELRP